MPGSTTRWRNPETGDRVIAPALPRRDAQLLGFFAPTAGDVLDCFRDPHAWPDQPRGGDSPSVIPASVFPIGAHHGAKLPTGRGLRSSSMATLIAAGPGICRGYEWGGDELGRPRGMDVVPATCHLLNLDLPRNQRGSVLNARL